MSGFSPGPLTWDSLTTYLGNYLQQDQPTEPWTQALPNITYNAELRIYRDLDFLQTRRHDTSLTFTAGTRTLDLTGMTNTAFLPVYPVVIQRVAAITPAGDQPAAGKRVQFLETSLDYLDYTWPQASTTQAPEPWFAYWAPISATEIAVVPTPDQNYVAEITGTWRPAPISSTNTQTWMSSNLPDLLFAAAMVEATGWMRDYGAQSDDPKLAMSWEATYQSRKAQAIEEEQRRKGYDPGWTPFSPTPLATQGSTTGTKGR